jgi:hypothetical protein
MLAVSWMSRSVGHLGVAGEGQGDLVPAPADGGVACRVGGVGDLVEEHHRVGEGGA